MFLFVSGTTASEKLSPESRKIVPRGHSDRLREHFFVSSESKVHGRLGRRSLESTGILFKAVFSTKICNGRDRTLTLFSVIVPKRLQFLDVVP